MKVKIEDLTSTALDWAVGTANGGLYQPRSARDSFWIWPGEPVRYSKTSPAYSTDWAQGGPIIDKEMLCIGYQHQADPNYCPMNDPATICWARTTAGGYLSYGPTPLIAAMRCYVASKFGDEVAVPDELLS